jgi:CRISPR/Cas system-associated protein Cas10 (large subunit of type III CRISPR-Cas system)
MNPIEAIEKLINERGSSEILKVRLELAKEEFEAQERKLSDAIAKAAKFEAELDRERSERKQAMELLAKLQEEYEEEIRIYKLVEFRRGKRTGGKWMGFCAQCHLPAHYNSHRGEIACTNYDCHWGVPANASVESMAEQLG